MAGSVPTNQEWALQCVVHGEPKFHNPAGSAVDRKVLLILFSNAITPTLRQTKKKTLKIKVFLQFGGAPRENRTPTSFENGF